MNNDTFFLHQTSNFLFTSKVTTHNHVTFCAPGNTLTHIEFEGYQIDYLGYHF